jgi:hypothetical protein
MYKKDEEPWPNFLTRWWNYFQYENKTYGFYRNIKHRIYVYFHDIIRPYNHIRISTLPRHYCEVEDRLIHGMFQLIVDFVEIEWDGGIGEYSQGKLLDLEKEEADYRKEGYDEETIAALIESDRRHNTVRQEVWDLYHWWKNVYPNRKDPMDDYHGGIPNFRASHFDENGKVDGYTLECDTEKHKEEWNKVCELSGAFEDACKKEDEEMMMRVIKIRHSLWT